MALGSAESLAPEDVMQDALQSTERAENVLTASANKDLNKLKLSTKDRQRVTTGAASTEEIAKESTQLKEQAERLLGVAEQGEKITPEEAKQLRKQLNVNSDKETRRSLLEDIQQKISTVGSTNLDKNQELDPANPELKRAYQTYDRLIEENKHLLGVEPAKEYKAWIREQKPTLKTLEEKTAKFFQTELPPRQTMFTKLKNTLNKYGVKEPLDLPYIELQGLSERTKFHNNIEQLEKFFDGRGDLKDKLYSKKTEKTLMEEICRAKTPQEQEHTLQRTKFIEKAESQNYTSLEKAIQQNRISQKSADNMLTHYKTIDNWGERLENIKLWDSFIENESKLTDDLKDIFDLEPANKKGFELAFRMFKTMDFVEKEKFIAKTKSQREDDIKVEEQNKQLAVDAFKHECTEAKKSKTISKSTEENYKKWIDSNSKGKSAEEIEKFLDMLTSPVPNEKYKNLKSYERNRKDFKGDLKKLEDISPQLTKKEIDKWQKDYDELGWNKRADHHEKLEKELDKAKDKRSGIETVSSPATAESKETSPALKNKETALKAIKTLEEKELYADALLLAKELLENNPKDEEANETFQRIFKKINASGSKEALNDKSMIKQFESTAELVIEGDPMIQDESRRLQTQDSALRMMEENIDRHHGTIKAQDRSKKELHEKTSGDSEVQEITDEYMEGADDDQVLDESTLKGREATVIDFGAKKDKKDEEQTRREVQKEQSKNKEEHGGSSVIEFKRKEGEARSLDKREARALHAKEENELVDQMVKKMTAITHPGEEPTPLVFATARKAALERLRKKEDDKMERMS